MRIKKEYILIVLIILGIFILEWITNSVSEGSVKAISKQQKNKMKKTALKKKLLKI